METILITGGTGFLGKRLGIALRKAGNEVVLAGRNNKQNLAARQFSGCEVIPMDVTSIESVKDGVSQVRPTTILHAAATKFVDLSEKFPMEAVDVNVTGSQNVARVAIDRGVRNVIGISTDKASPPVRNTYGMTKALMERMFCSLNGKTDTRFSCVRYGNVAWSTGSVLCIWRKMLKENNQIETTGPEMFRFFFTVDEAVALVLTATQNIDQFQGKVLSRQMKAAQMKDIIQVWVDQTGGMWKEITGRPGERNEEFLFGEIELPFTQALEIGGIPHYLITFNQRAPDPLTEVLSSRNAQQLNRDEILALINNPPLEEI